MVAERIDPAWTVVVPEHAAFTLVPAGPLLRLFAYVIDLFLRALVFVGFIVILGTVGLGDSGLGLLLLVWFIIEWGWHVLFEGLRAGQTPGKKWLGLRVVDRDGRPPSLSAAILRNLLRVADWLPAGYGLALAVMSLDRGFRRLGDLAAGTLVVRRAPEGLVPPPPAEAARDADALAARLPAAQIAYLPRSVGDSLARYTAVRDQFSPPRRAEMAARLSGRLAQNLGFQAPRDPDRFLVAVDALYRKSQQGHQAAEAERLMTRRKAEGQRTKQMLHAPVTLTPARGLELGRLHRNACADLALAQAFALAPDRIRVLEDEVAGTHARLHRPPRAELRHLGAVLGRARARLRADLCWRISAITFFGSFGAAIASALADPGLAASVLGQDLLDHMEAMYQDRLDGRSGAEAAGMVGFYIRHNVSIALTCFASGLLAGIGSLTVLLFNGVVLGLIFGHMLGLTGPTRDHFLEFVTAHGPFELTGIAICGAAGLRLGWGAITTRGLGLAAALRRSAGEALPLLVMGALLVALAAPIEAFISPSTLSWTTKTVVGLICLSVLVLVMVLPTRSRHA